MKEDTMIFVAIPEKFKGDVKAEHENAKKLCTELGINDANIIEDFLEEDIPPVQNPDLWKAGIIVTQLADTDYVYFADGWKLDSHCVFIYNICKKNNIKIIKE